MFFFFIRRKGGRGDKSYQNIYHISIKSNLFTSRKERGCGEGREEEGRLKSPNDRTNVWVKLRVTFFFFNIGRGMRRGGRGAGWMGGCKAWNLIGRAKYVV